METRNNKENTNKKYVFENWSLKEDIRRILTENIDEYESEKLHYLTTTFDDIVKKLHRIDEYIKKADELDIKVKKDFTFNHLYKAYFDTAMCKEPVDWKEFSDKLDKYEEDLKNAIELYYFKYHRK